MRGLGSISTGSITVHWTFLFSRSKASAANICISAILVHFEKTVLTRHSVTLMSTQELTNIFSLRSQHVIIESGVWSVLRQGSQVSLISRGR